MADLSLLNKAADKALKKSDESAGYKAAMAQGGPAPEGSSKQWVEEQMHPSQVPCKNCGAIPEGLKQPEEDPVPNDLGAGTRLNPDKAKKFVKGLPNR